METSFAEKVYAIVRAIPKGKTRTYAEVAAASGSPRAARAVGMLMSQNKDITVPCHRVIRSDGKLGQYNGLRGNSKAEILQEEGVKGF